MEAWPPFPYSLLTWSASMVSSRKIKGDEWTLNLSRFPALPFIDPQRAAVASVIDYFCSELPRRLYLSCLFAFFYSLPNAAAAGHQHRETRGRHPDRSVQTARGVRQVYREAISHSARHLHPSKNRYFLFTSPLENAISLVRPSSL